MMEHLAAAIEKMGGKIDHSRKDGRQPRKGECQHRVQSGEDGNQSRRK
jgi:hypothetical protein